MIRCICLLMGSLMLLMGGLVLWTRREISFEHLLLTRDESRHYYLMTPDGSFKSWLLDGEGRQLVVWLPDQDRLLYTERINNSAGSSPIELLYRQVPGKNTAQPIAAVPAWNAIFPYIVAPNQKMIAYVSQVSPYTVQIINTAGRLQTTIEIAPQPPGIGWTRDSQHLLIFGCTGYQDCNLRFIPISQPEQAWQIDHIPSNIVLPIPGTQQVIYSVDSALWRGAADMEPELLVEEQAPLDLVAANRQAVLYHDRAYLYWMNLETRQHRQLLEFEFYANSVNLFPQRGDYFVMVDTGSVHEIYRIRLDDGSISLLTTVEVQARSYFYTHIALMPDEKSLLYGLEVDTLDGLNERIMVYYQVDLRTGEQRYLPVNGYTIPAQFSELKSQPSNLLVAGLLFITCGIFPLQKVIFR